MLPKKRPGKKGEGKLIESIAGRKPLRAGKESPYMQPATPEEKARFFARVDKYEHIPPDIRSAIKARFARLSNASVLEMNSFLNIFRDLYHKKGRTKKITEHLTLEEFLEARKWREEPMSITEMNELIKDLKENPYLTRQEKKEILIAWARKPDISYAKAHALLHFFIGKKFIHKTKVRRARARWHSISGKLGINLKKLRLRPAMLKVMASPLTYIDKVGLAKFLVERIKGKSQKWRKEKLNEYKVLFQKESSYGRLFKKTGIPQAPQKINFEKDMKRVIFFEMPLIEKLALIQAIIIRKKPLSEWNAHRKEWHKKLQNVRLFQSHSKQLNINLEKIHFKRDMNRVLKSNLDQKSKQGLMHLIIELSRRRADWPGLKNMWEARLADWQASQKKKK